MEYEVDCPFTGPDRRCALFEECNEHSRPGEPESECPPYRWDGSRVVRDEQGHPVYVVDADPQAVKEWTAYEEAMEVWEADHHPGYGDDIGYHRADACWVQTWVTNDQLGSGWDLVGFKRVKVDGPIPVDWVNRGDVDDSYLELTPWKK